MARPTPARQFVATLAVGLFLVFLAGTVLTPPDPLTQLLVTGPGVLATLVGTGALVYGGGYERLGGSPSLQDHAAFVAVVVAVGVAGSLAAALVEMPGTARVVGVAATLLALGLGGWLGYAGGRDRLGR